MVSRTEWYGRVNASWPAEQPPLTAEEAVRAAKKLYRFTMRRTWTGGVKVTSGNRYSWPRHGDLVVNPDNGWHSLIHDLSHWLHRTIGGDRPHNKDHAKLELKLRKEALRRGWLDGALQSKPKPEKPLLDPKVLRYQRTVLAIVRWQTKEKRAKTALRKLVARKKHYERIGISA